MTVSQVMDLTVVSQNFPILPEPQIPRENILQTLETVLAGDTEVIFVEGDPGSGKTTLLGQFALAHPMQAIALFVRVTSRWAYDPLILKVDLCNQLSWILNREELGDSEELDDAFLRTSLTRLARRAKRNRETYYFLLDGLEEIPEDDSSIRQSILQMLPFGNAHFRFLISGDAELYTNDLHEGLKRKPFILTGFTLDQTHIYLSDMGFTRRDLEETHKICGGNPGHLASIRRIVKTGTDKDKLLAEMPRHLPGLFEIEWRAVDTSNEWHLLALAIIAHDRRPHKVNPIVKTTNRQN